MMVRRSILLLIFALLALPPAAFAAEMAASRLLVTDPASADGIGKSYMGREIAQVMGVGGAPWLERSERAHEEGTDLVLAAVDINPDTVIADIGAGTGYYAPGAWRGAPAREVWCMRWRSSRG